MGFYPGPPRFQLPVSSCLCVPPESSTKFRNQQPCLRGRTSALVDDCKCPSSTHTPRPGYPNPPERLNDRTAGPPAPARAATPNPVPQARP